METWLRQEIKRKKKIYLGENKVRKLEFCDRIFFNLTQTIEFVGILVKRFILGILVEGSILVK